MSLIQPSKDVPAAASGIRLAKAEDLHSAAVETVLARCLGDPTAAGLERARRAYARGEHTRLYLYSVDGVISGVMGLADRLQGRTEIAHIAVAAAAERQGIARGLVRHACEVLQTRTIDAETDEDAVGFYRTLGFAIQPLGSRDQGRERFRCSWSAAEGALALTAARADETLDVWSMLQEMPEHENGFFNGAQGLPRAAWKEHLQRLIDAAHGAGLAPDRVPQTTFWLWNRDRPVGTSKLRHRLNQELMRRGGHVGYCIRPSDRGKGHGCALLRLTLRWARLYGLKRLLLTCDSGNTPSRSIIERNGGVLAEEAQGTCRYWIDLA